MDKPEKPFAAPCKLKTAPARLNEANDDYRLIMAQLNARWRVIDGKCGLQWILQRRDAAALLNWRGNAYCCTRDALLCNIRERRGDATEAGLRAVERLEDRHG